MSELNSDAVQFGRTSHPPIPLSLPSLHSAFYDPAKGNRDRYLIFGRVVTSRSTGSRLNYLGPMSRIDHGASSAKFWSGPSSSSSSTPLQTPLLGSHAGQPSSSSSTVELIGVTRSRTLLFLSYRDSVPRGPSARRRRQPQTQSRSDGSSAAPDPLGATATGKGKARSTSNGAYFDFDAEEEDDVDPRDQGQYDRKSSLTQSRYEDDDDEEDAALLQQRSSYDSRRQRDHSVVEIPALPPRWVDVSDQIDAMLSSLSPQIATLDRLQAKHLLPGFVDRTQEEREIAKLQGNITREFAKCSKLIAGLAQDLQRKIQASKSGQGPAMSNEEAVLARNVQTALAQRVQDASGQFRKKQSNYMQRLKGQDIRHREVLGDVGGRAQRGGGGDNSISSSSEQQARGEELAAREDLEMSKAHLAGQQPQQEQMLLFDSEQQQRGDQADVDVAQRHSEITRIASSIVELSQLFQDLQSLVIDQGSLVDRIDYNIETMGKDMARANEELQVATKTQRRTGRGQCILFLVLLCALLIAVIIVKPFWRFIAGGSSTEARPA